MDKPDPRGFQKAGFTIAWWEKDGAWHVALPAYPHQASGTNQLLWESAAFDYASEAAAWAERELTKRDRAAIAAAEGESDEIPDVHPAGRVIRPGCCRAHWPAAEGE